MEASAALDRARRDLGPDASAAPIAGTATQVTSIQMGRYLTAGTAVFSIVASDKPWVDANPKETDLTYLQAGPDGDHHGRCLSRPRSGTASSPAISPGTGAQFAILPPQNASGNWVKVVQRVPVRIEFDAGRGHCAAARGHERQCRDRHRPPAQPRPPARLDMSRPRCAGQVH